MFACRSALQGAARVLAEQEGSRHRWKSTTLRRMYTGILPAGECGDVFVYTGELPPGGCGSVYTYNGFDLELSASNGSWDMATYECDYDHESGRIVDVRAARGFLP